MSWSRRESDSISNKSVLLIYDDFFSLWNVWNIHNKLPPQFILVPKHRAQFVPGLCNCWWKRMCIECVLRVTGKYVVIFTVSRFSLIQALFLLRSVARETVKKPESASKTGYQLIGLVIQGERPRDHGH